MWKGLCKYFICWCLNAVSVKIEATQLIEECDECVFLKHVTHSNDLGPGLFQIADMWWRYEFRPVTFKEGSFYRFGHDAPDRCLLIDSGLVFAVELFISEDWILWSCNLILGLIIIFPSIINHRIWSSSRQHNLSVILHKKNVFIIEIVMTVQSLECIFQLIFVVSIYYFYR